MWDKYKACDNLGIPYKVYDMTKAIGGYTELKDRFIHINKSNESDDRVWAHEIAHALFHFKKLESAFGIDKELNAIAEIEADTTAYIVTQVLGQENAEYLGYIEHFLQSIPLSKLNETLINDRLNTIIEKASLILTAGGYYEHNERN